MSNSTTAAAVFQPGGMRPAPEASTGGSPRARGVPAAGREARNKQAGLSTAHICRKQKTGKVTGYVGGSLVRASYPAREGKQVGGGKRGKVKPFTRASRLRFMRLLAAVLRDHLPLFVTLTYPDIFPDELERLQADFKRFRARLAGQGGAAIWRREWKIRKSGARVGQVAPHYHLLLWGMTRREALEFLPGAWYESCGRLTLDHKKAGTSVEVARSWRQVTGYTSKYLAKAEDREITTRMDDRDCGRSWGVINREAIPWAAEITLEVSVEVIKQMFRYFRKLLHSRGRSSWRSSTVFVEDPWRWLQLANYHLPALVSLAGQGYPPGAAGSRAVGG